MIAYTQDVLFSTFSTFIEVSNRYSIQQIKHFLKIIKIAVKMIVKKLK